MTTPHVAQISVFNLATTPIPFDLSALVAAMQKYVDSYLYQVWGCLAKLTLTDGPVKGTWSLVFYDNADVPDALAYHDEEGHQPVSKVFVETTLNDGEDVAVSATHELAEMLVDAPINRYASAGDGFTLYAYEVCDPVEDQSFLIDGLRMSNFVYPSYFEPDPLGSTQKFDQMGSLTAPFTLTTGGYAIVTQAGNFRQVFGSQGKATKRSSQDRRGHRGWLRGQDLSKSK